MRRSVSVPRGIRLAALLGVVALVASACASVRAVEPNEAGEIQVTLTDNRISPSVIRVKAGQKVRFVITNDGQHPHEFMIGRNPRPVDDYRNLGKEVVEPFEVDFFHEVEVSVSGTGMAMGFEGMAPMDMGGDQGDMDMGGDQGDMDMGGDQGGMDMGGDQGDMDMGGDQGDMDMGGDQGDMDMGGDQGGMDMGGGEEAPHGAMVMLQPGQPGTSEPGQTSIIEFVVPEDAVGTWTIACFQEAGQHFADGMRATLIVEA